MSHRRTATFLLVCALTFLGCASTAEQRTAVGQPTETLFASQDVPSLWSPRTPVGQVVADQPAAARIFELVGIDYCCGGEVPLADAADAKGISVNRLLSALGVVGPTQAGEASPDWLRASLDDLMAHIANTYHVELRQDLPRLEELIATVRRVHGADHSELPQLQATFLALQAEMHEHLELEEQILFPAISKLARGDAPGDVESLLRLMIDDHEGAGEALETLHRLTNGYAPPADACVLYREMLRSLDRLERQTLAHIHLENNILAPRTRALLTQRTLLTR